MTKPLIRVTLDSLGNPAIGEVTSQSDVYPLILPVGTRWTLLADDAAPDFFAGDRKVVGVIPAKAIPQLLAFARKGCRLHFLVAGGQGPNVELNGEETLARTYLVIGDKMGGLYTTGGLAQCGIKLS